MIGERIKILRTERNLTQAALAHALGIAKTTLAAYEQDKNEPSNETFIKIANYFNVSADYLLGLTDVKSADANIASIRTSKTQDRSLFQYFPHISQRIVLLICDGNLRLK